MAADKDMRWIYSKQILEETPSRKDRIDAEKELSYRQQAANLIQDMGQRLSVNQLTINTAIVYMHRFYVYHSFTVFSRYAIAPTALFLAAKVEEQPKKLEHVLKICHACLQPDKPHLDTHSDAYLKQAQELVQNELVLLQTLGFDISVDHPHTHVVKCTQLVKASRDLSQMAYFMATNSLHLTTFCLLYKPTVVAAMCIHLSCKWSNYEIPLSSDGKPYWAYMDPVITEPLLNTIVGEFLKILNRCPTRLRKLKNYRPSQSSKEGHDAKNKEDANNTASQQHPVSQGTSQPDKPQSQPQPVKEKKPTMSYEEYKRTHPTKSAVKPAPPSNKLHHQHPSGVAKKPDNHPPAALPHAPSRPNNSLPHHNTARPHHGKDHVSQHQPKFTHPPNKVQNNQPHSNRSSGYDANNKSVPRPPDHQQIKDKVVTKPAERPRPLKPGDVSHQQAASTSRMRFGVTQQNESRLNSEESAEVLAVTKDLEGRIHNEKLLQQRSATEAFGRQKPSQQVASASHLQGNPSAKDSSHRQTSDRPPHEVHVNKESRQLDYKKMVEMYHKTPDKLRHYLKHKAQSFPLNREESNLLMKLQAKEDEKRKRKAAEYQASKQNKTSSSRAETTANVDSPGPPITLRIKIPKTPVDNSAGKVKIVGSNSGSDSQASPRSRKRAHGDSSGHSSAKYTKRSDEFHQNHNSSNRGSSSSGNKHKHNKHQSRSAAKQTEPIDEAVFQKSLSDALTKVQQAGGPSIPTVTLKRASNGKESNYFTSSSINRNDFNPALPVSAQMPDDIFEDEQDSGAFMGPGASNIGSLTSGDSSQQSTPEPGEIKDDATPFAKSSKFFPEKVPGLFSPPSDVDAKLHRTVSGYHSGTENEFSSNAMLHKPVQNRY